MIFCSAHKNISIVVLSFFSVLNNEKFGDLLLDFIEVLVK